MIDLTEPVSNPKPTPPQTTKHSRRTNFSGSTVIRWVTGSITTLPLLALIAIAAVLALEAFPAIKYNGFGFLTRIPWNPGSQYAAAVKTNGVLHLSGVSYGAYPLIFGTVVSSIIAIAIAIPVSLGGAIALVYKLPRAFARFVGIFIEVLAGIPSVIYGLWGSLTLGPYLSNHIYPTFANFFARDIHIKFFTGNVGHGEGLLTTGIVLAIMVVPIVASTARDLLRQVPTVTTEGAYALGLSEGEVVRKVSLRWVSSGLIGACVLGLARALGETMAVAMVSGAVLGSVPVNLYSPFTTIAATIVSQLDSAFTDGTQFAVRTLAEAALVLLAITIITNIIARVLVKRVASTALPVGRGI